MNLRKKIGMDYGDVSLKFNQEDRIKYINFKLAALGLPIYEGDANNLKSEEDFIDLYEDIIEDYREKKRLLSVSEIPINKRINNFFSGYFGDDTTLEVVSDCFVLDRYGLARELSLPPNGDEFINEHMESYRIKQGVLNNPRHDRRTTKGSFHLVEGELNVPFDKKEVPKETFQKIYNQAINPPEDYLQLPFTSNQHKKAKTFVSLHVKPIISPKVEGIMDEKVMEVKYVVPGSFVTNLDFVESVFGNAGDPSLHINDAGIDVHHWSGHTGYIILAPHLTKVKKKDVGLPPFEEATERQRREGMCYKNEDELYNNGVPFKLSCRDHNGVIVTIIADTYFGYSKKEIKTEISYAANLFGMVEEEHAGGTIAFPRKNVGINFKASEMFDEFEHDFEYVKKNYHGLMHLIEEKNYGIDKKYSNILYLPENIEIDLHKTEIKWQYNNKIHQLKLLPDHYYVLPNGYKLHIEKHPSAPAWKLLSTAAEGTFCHKPCTVSGGGKSEISKSLDNSIIYGTYFCHNLEKDLDQVQAILDYDYRHRWKDEPNRTRPSRPILSTERTLGSVIKLLTPSPKYTDEFNDYLKGIPNYIKALVFMVKRFYIEEWGDNWREHFSVDVINGKPGNEVNFNGRKIRPSYLRVGFYKDSWRIFKLRMDFMSAEKIQMEDDISSSIVLPADQIKNINSEYNNPSFKFTNNCEYRFFQRPDDAIHKGFDQQAEKDLSSDYLFATNYEPLKKEDVQSIKENVIEYINYTEPVQEHIEAFLQGDNQYCIVSSEPRLLDGKPSKNPRYLQTRNDFKTPIKEYLAAIGVRLIRKIPKDQAVNFPVNSILAGRRNNPPGLEDGKKILPLSVYNPIHYQELPELFMDFMSSLSGKSPSTTGSGSEGALTKGPFNMLLPAYDLNNALLSYILTDYKVFTTPAGYIGPEGRVDHDISMLIPELWSRLSEEERNPDKMIDVGALEKVEDFEYEGETILASRLGYRITEVFSYRFLGKIFDEPQTVFSKMLLRPEQQDLEAFVDGIRNIVKGHERIAKAYITDGTVDQLIPPLEALVHIMATGEYNGFTIHDNEIRNLFTREYVINSDWYQQRLKNKQKIDIKLMETKINNLENFVNDPVNQKINKEFSYYEQLAEAKKLLNYYKTDQYLASLVGTIGAEDIAL